MFPLAADGARGLKSAPWVSMAFLIAYLAVLFTYQLGEDRKEQALADWYVESGLYELEFTNYISFLRISGHIPLAESVEAHHTAGDRLAVVRAMAFDPDFEQENRERGDQYWNYSQREHWYTQRMAFKDRAQAIPRYRFGLVPSAPRPATYLTWHFLQDSWVQWLVTVLVSLLFLWPTEARLGQRRMLIVWMFSGVLTGMVYVAALQPSFIPMIGSTPMAAVVIGAYLSLFGLRKLDFIWYHPKQKQVRITALPAIVLAPLWLALPVYEYLGGSLAPHVWVAQLSGLLAGALLVQLAQRQDVKGIESLQDQEAQDTSQLRQQLQSGWASMAALEFRQAQECFEKVLAIQPLQFEALSGLYHIHKLQPESEAFRAAADRVLTMQSDDEGITRQQYALYKDYIRTCGLNAELDPAARILTVIRMVRVDEMREAEQLAQIVSEDIKYHEELPRMYRVLAEAHENYGNGSKANHYRGLASRADEGVAA